MEVLWNEVLSSQNTIPAMQGLKQAAYGPPVTSAPRGVIGKKKVGGLVLPPPLSHRKVETFFMLTLPSKNGDFNTVGCGKVSHTFPHANIPMLWNIIGKYKFNFILHQKKNDFSLEKKESENSTLNF